MKNLFYVGQPKCANQPISFTLFYSFLGLTNTTTATDDEDNHLLIVN